MLTKLIERAQEAISARQRYLNTVYELSRLSDRDLKDLGIHRGNIKFIARESVKKGRV